VNSAMAPLNLRRSAQSLHAAGVVGDDVQMGRRVDSWLDLDAAVVAATHRGRGCFRAVVDEAEAVERRQLQQVARHAQVGHRNGQAGPVEMNIGTGLRDVGSTDQKHRVVVHGLADQYRARWLSVDLPPDDAGSAGEAAVRVRGHREVVLGDDACVLHVEIAVQITVRPLARLLVSVDLIAEDEGKGGWCSRQGYISAACTAAAEDSPSAVPYRSMLSCA